jgi:hypothetical protein
MPYTHFFPKRPANQSRPGPRDWPCHHWYLICKNLRRQENEVSHFWLDDVFLIYNETHYLMFCGILQVKPHKTN